MALELKAAYLAWLEPYRWDWFCTLTLRPRIGRESANRDFKNWISDLEKEGKSQLSWVRVAEFGRFGQRLHFHALIAGVRRVSADYAESLWKRMAGRAEIGEYDGTRNGIGYLLKPLETGPEIDLDADLSDRHLIERKINRRVQRPAPTDSRRGRRADVARQNT